MKFLTGFLFSLIVSASVQAAPVHYTGDIHGDGHYEGQLDINFGWIDPPFGLNSWGDHVDLWQIKGNAGEKLSLALTSEDTNLGFSLYFGEISADDLLHGLFTSQGDVGNADYLTGSPLWGDLQQLNNFSLTHNGVYTLVVGGRDFAGYSGYNYDLAVSTVPEPSSALLIALGMLATMFARRRRDTNQ